MGIKVTLISYKGPQCHPVQETSVRDGLSSVRYQSLATELLSLSCQGLKEWHGNQYLPGHDFSWCFYYLPLFPPCSVVRFRCSISACILLSLCFQLLFLTLQVRAEKLDLFNNPTATDRPDLCAIPYSSFL